MNKTKLTIVSALTLLVTGLIPVQALASVENCGGEDLRQASPVLYSARFQMGGLNQPAKKMQVVIGMSKVKQGGFARPYPIAQIWSGSQCQALCKVASVEKENQLTPVALEMSCESTGFSPLAVKTQILWAGDKSVYMAKKPTIRFGTWLEGYRDSALSIDQDRYSMSPDANRGVAIASAVSRK